MADTPVIHEHTPWPPRRGIKCVRCQADPAHDPQRVNGEIMCGYCAHMWAKGEAK
jgi:hypothetical protein